MTLYVLYDFKEEGSKILQSCLGLRIRSRRIHIICLDLNSTLCRLSYYPQIQIHVLIQIGHTGEKNKRNNPFFKAASKYLEHVISILFIFLKVVRCVHIVH